MKKTALAALVSILTGAAVASAGTITVQNLSSITVPETRVYKQCLGAFQAQIFGSLAPGFSSTQTRTAPVQGACVWAREVGIEPRYISCFDDTMDLPVPSEPATITVTWTGTSADNLACTVVAQ